MRIARLFSVGCCAAVAVSTLGCGAAADPPPRNLLLITLDTLRADHLGIYGYDRPTSPALDAFAAQATVFTDVTCSMPTTLPSHASIFTGLRPAQHGVRRNGQAPDRDLVTIFDLLADRGAATGAVIASRVVEERYLDGLGFQEVIYPGSEREFQTEGKHITDQAVSWLERNREAPFALWVHYFDTHEPYAPPAHLARSFDRGYDGELGNALSVKTLVGFNDLPPEDRLSEADRRHVTDLYDAEIAYLDSQLGRLFAGLDSLDLLENTLVVIVGDHGQALGESTFYGHGLRLLEPVIQIPLIIRSPGRPTVSRVDAPVEAVDLVPTLIDLFELPSQKDGLTGRSLAAALSGDSLSDIPYRLIERRAYPDQPDAVGVALRGRTWKAVYYRDEDGTETRTLNRAVSGFDGADLYDADGADAGWLEDAWTTLPRSSSASPAELDDETQRMLRALGYLD